MNEDLFNYWPYALALYFVIHGTFIAIRKTRGMFLPKPSEEELNSLFNEMENVPLTVNFDDRIDSTTTDLDIFEDHIDKFFASLSIPAKQHHILFRADDLWMPGGSGGYPDSSPNVLHGKNNEFVIRRAYYDGRGPHKTHEFRVEFKITYNPTISAFVGSVDWNERRLAIIDSLERAVRYHFNFSLEEAKPEATHA